MSYQQAFIFVGAFVLSTAAASQSLDLGEYGAFSASTDLNRRVARTDIYGNQVIDIWVETNHENDRSVPYRRRLTLNRVRCDTRETSVMQYISYDRNGRVIDSNNWQVPNYQSAAPQTLGEAVIAAACYQG